MYVYVNQGNDHASSITMLSMKNPKVSYIINSD
jgi:hypothetical protein